MNTTKILQERIRVAFAPAGEPGFEAPTPDELARPPSDACLAMDLPQRIAAVRNNLCGRVVFTTSFGIEDQAIAHAIFSQGLAILRRLVQLDNLEPDAALCERLGKLRRHSKICNR